jgi:P27 family predicted phage terminase small subunit
MPTSQFPKVVPTRNPLRSGPVSPPTHLDEEEQALFRSIVNEFRIDDAGSVELLVTACEAHARCRVCRETIDKEGMTVKDRFGVLQPHPLLKTEASARGQYLASLRALNLEPPQPSKRWIAR